MPIKQVNPYLNFGGNANDAIKLYESALGAKADNVMPFDKDPSRVMHARLHFAGGGMVMLSDGPPNMTVPTESNTHVSLDWSDADEMKRAFEALSAGGKVTMPLADQFWGATFGMLTDRYGIHWMFNCEKKKS